jgi:outer membrane scaffolding protein for murein synthesis (MipA/OmpV family)
MIMNPRILGALALVFMLPAAAQQTPALPLWEAGVVGFAVSTPAYPGADLRSSRLLALPFLIYRGEVLRSDTGGIGARLVRTERLEFDVGFAGSLPARSDAVAARAGMPDLGTLIEFGPRVKLLLANPTPTSRLRLEMPLRAVIELRGGARRQGATFEPRLVYETRETGSPWSYDASIGLVIGDSRINRYFYAVAPQYASAGRPAYSAGAGLMLLRAGLSGSYRLNQDVRLFGFVRQESYAGAANRDSPLMKKDSGASIGAGFAWTIGRSSSPARGAP